MLGTTGINCDVGQVDVCLYKSYKNPWWLKQAVLNLQVKYMNIVDGQNKLFRNAYS